MHVSSVHAAGSAHVRDDPKKFSRFEQPQTIDTGLGANHCISAPFKCSTNVGHHSGFILDEQHRQSGRFQGGATGGHGWITPAAAPRDAGSDVTGRRTTKVAPSPPALL